MLGVVLLFVVLIIAVAFSLDTIIKKGVDRIGPEATKTQVTLRGADAKIFSGLLELKGVFVGNPQGYKLPSAITAEDISVSVTPASVFSPKLVVKNITLKEPIITLEGGLKDNNLTQIEKNLNDYIGSSSTAPNSPAPNPAAPSSAAKPERKLQVNDLVITGAKLEVNTTLSGGRTITLAIPDIHLTDLGTGPEGITAVEVGQRTLHAILDKATAAIAKNAMSLGTQELGEGKGAAQKAVDKLKGLFHH